MSDNKIQKILTELSALEEMMISVQPSSTEQIQRVLSNTVRYLHEMHSNRGQDLEKLLLENVKLRKQVLSLSSSVELGQSCSEQKYLSDKLEQKKKQLKDRARHIQELNAQLTQSRNDVKKLENLISTQLLSQQNLKKKKPELTKKKPKRRQLSTMKIATREDRTGNFIVKINDVLNDGKFCESEKIENLRKLIDQVDEPSKINLLEEIQEKNKEIECLRKVKFFNTISVFERNDQIKDLLYGFLQLVQNQFENIESTVALYDSKIHTFAKTYQKLEKAKVFKNVSKFTNDVTLLTQCEDNIVLEDVSRSLSERHKLSFDNTKIEDKQSIGKSDEIYIANILSVQTDNITIIPEFYVDEEVDT